MLLLYTIIKQSKREKIMKLSHSVQMLVFALVTGLASSSYAVEPRVKVLNVHNGTGVDLVIRGAFQPTPKKRSERFVTVRAGQTEEINKEIELNKLDDRRDAPEESLSKSDKKVELGEIREGKALYISKPGKDPIASLSIIREVRDKKEGKYIWALLFMTHITNY